MPAHPRRPAETIGELNRGYREQNRPVTDGSRELHSLCAQLEFLLQVAPRETEARRRCPGLSPAWGHREEPRRVPTGGARWIPKGGDGDGHGDPPTEPVSLAV